MFLSPAIVRRSLQVGLLQFWERSGPEAMIDTIHNQWTSAPAVASSDDLFSQRDLAFPKFIAVRNEFFSASDTLTDHLM